VRVVSLVPSVTETLLAWGIRPVACTRFCDQPGIATVGGTKNPDVAAIVAMAPDLVVMDEEENRREDHQALVAAGVSVHVLAVRSVTDVGAQLPALAERLGRTWAGAAVVGPEVVGAEVVGAEVVGAEAAGPEDRSAPRPPLGVVVPIWRRPWMVLGPGTYAASLLEVVGAQVVAPPQGGRYPTFDLDEMATLAATARRRGPVVVLAPSEPYPFKDRHRAELEVVAPVHFVDGRDLFWWGARSASAARRVQGVLEPLRTMAAVSERPAPLDPTTHVPM
jgi:ABC-type Fe3+-hydroxamate transport system substrate-binding protein